MEYKTKALVEAIDKLISYRVMQGQPGYHLPRNTIAEALEELGEALEDFISEED
jgi:hypothetical protein